LELNGKKLANGSLDPYVIAEIGVNYYDIARKEGISPLEAAERMILAAHEAGADAAKFQTYKSEKIASRHSPAYWDTTKETSASQYDLFKKHDHFGEAEYRHLADFAREHGTTFLSTPFDLEAVDFLDEIIPVFKIASADITNIPLLEKIAEKKKPILLAVGASSIADIRSALDKIDEVNPEAEIALLQCILNYPTLPPNANLGMIQGIQDAFPGYPVGYSDHTEPSEDMLEVIMAVLSGACIVEKHFTLDKRLPGNDHYHAMDPADLKKFKDQLNRCRVLYGSREKRILPSEEPAVKYARRSIVLKAAVRHGERITSDHLIMKRPGTGIPPTELQKVVGMVVNRDLEEDTILLWEHLEKGA